MQKNGDSSEEMGGTYQGNIGVTWCNGTKKISGYEDDFTTSGLGPFRVNYTGTASISVTDTNGNVISTSNYTLYNSSNNQISGITSGQDFYIKLTSSNYKYEDIGNVNISVSGTTINCTIYILESTTTNNGKTKQYLIATDHSTDKISKSIDIEIKVKPSTGDLTVIKVDSSNSKTYLSMGFKVQVLDTNGNQVGWLSGSAGKWTYTNRVSDSNTTFYTSSSDGKKELTELSLSYTYVVWETEAPSDDYDLSYQDGYCSTTGDCNGFVNLSGNIKLKDYTNYTVKKTYSNKKTPTGDIEVQKVDYDTGEALEGMKFKIQTSAGWLGYNESTGKWIYNATKDGAKEFTTGSDGTYTVENLKIIYEYKIWETETPSKWYLLEDQEGYDDDTSSETYGWVDLTTQDYTEDGWVNLGDYDENDYDYVLTATNKSKLISISGYVWLEEGDKDDDWDNLWGATYDDNGNVTGNEIRVNGVNVTLKDKDGWTVTYEDGTEAKTTTKGSGDSGGQYLFTDVVRYSLLKDCYVEFDYSGTLTNATTNEELKDTYITAAFNSTVKSEIKDNGSRALVEEVAESDEEYINSDSYGIATTYTGTNSDEEITYGLSGNGNLFSMLYDEDSNTFEYINLGLKPMYDPDYSLTQSLEYVKIVLGDYTYVYEYGSGTELEGDNIPSVSYQSSNNISVYSRYFYPSAIYTLMDSDDSNDLEVYVVYSMTITTPRAYKEEEIYVDTSLCITSLTNSFDSSRYELETEYNDITGTSFEDEDIDDDFGCWKYDGEEESGYVRYKWTGDSNGTFTINSEDEEEVSETKYIQFKVKDDAITDILNNPSGIAEKYPTTAKTVGYHNYTRLDYSWNNMSSEGVSATQNHETVDKEKVSSGAYIVFKLPDEDIDEDRTVSGYVFEDTDKDTDDSSALGNGQYEDSENLVSGVKVQLLNADGSPAQKYEVITDEDGNEQTELVNFETYTTGDNGYYEFVGVLPGEYVICLTYGDGSQYIVDGNGTVVSLDDYKSTVVTSNVARNALGYATNDYGDEWYKYLEGNNYSVAVDNLDTRASYNDGNDETEITAKTATINVTIENTTYTNTSEDEEVDANTFHKEIFEGFNLGIIKQPEQTAKVEKLITNVKLINTPTQIFDGNPESGNLTGVSDLDGSDNGGSTYTRVEIDEDLIYGSEFTIEYTISIENTSQENYYENDSAYKGWYYMFGETISGVSYEVELSAETIKDYLDEYLKYTSNSSNINVTQESEVDEEGYTTLTITGLESIKRNDSKSFTVTAYKVLSTADDDLAYNNIADVTELINVTNSDDSKKDENASTESLKLVKSPILPDRAEAYITISAPTGQDRGTIIMYAVVGLTMLVILSVGIVVIKKKVL